jgi:hypothetical protein
LSHGFSSSPVCAVSSVEAVKDHFGGKEPDLIVILVKSRDTLKAAGQAAQLQVWICICALFLLLTFLRKREANRLSCLCKTELGMPR